MQLPLVDGCLILDNSTLETWQACPQEYVYKHLRKRQLAIDRPGLNFGSVVHELLRYRYVTFGNAKVPDDAFDGFAALSAEWFDKHPEPVGDHRNHQLACAFVKAYNQFYGKEPFKLLSLNDGKLFVEKSFLTPLGVLTPFDCVVSLLDRQPIDANSWVQITKAQNNIPVFWSGRIDLGIEDNEGEWVFDHKTAFQFGRSNDAEISTYPAMRGYCWQFRNYYGRKPAGYIINSIRVRPPTKAAQYDDSLLFERPDFKRTPVHVTDDDIDEWRENVAEMIGSLCWHVLNDRIVRYRKNCVGKYGPCGYYDCCTLPRKNRDAYIASGLFQDYDWSPLNRPEGE